MGILATLADWQYRARTNPGFAFKFSFILWAVIASIICLAVSIIMWDDYGWYIIPVSIGVILGAGLLFGGLAYLGASYLQETAKVYQKRGRMTKSAAMREALGDARHRETQGAMIGMMGVMANR